MSTYLNHVTLSTGHTARTTRRDVTDDTIKSLKPWLNAALDNMFRCNGWSQAEIDDDVAYWDQKVGP